MGLKVCSANDPKMQEYAIVAGVCMGISIYKENRRIKMEMEQMVS